MPNKVSKVAVGFTLAAAILLVGFLILMPTLHFNAGEEENLGFVFVALWGMIFAILGGAVVYLSAIPFIIIALVFGIKMLKEQEQGKLLSLHVRMLITACVLLLFLVVGGYLACPLIVYSQLGLFPLIYAAATAVVYLVCIIVQIVAVVRLKKSAKASAKAPEEEQTNEEN